MSLPVDSCDWDLLRVLLGVLEVEERVEPALLAREMGSGTGVTGGESSWLVVEGRGGEKKKKMLISLKTLHQQTVQ